MTPAEYTREIDENRMVLFTPVFVRRLLNKAREIGDANPQKSAELTQVAVDVAFRLDETTIHTVLLQTLRGEALREHAESVSALGRHAEALDLIDRARAQLEATASGTFGLALLTLTHANVLHRIKRGGEAIFELRSAASVFTEFEDAEHYRTARQLEAGIYYSLAKYREALKIWLELAAEPDLPPHVEAAISSNAGNCFREIGDLERAFTLLTRAREAYAATDRSVPKAKVEWSLAKLLLSHGRALEAVEALQAVVATFEQLAMRGEAALARLDIAEAMVTVEDFDAADELCRRLIADFGQSGNQTSTLVALAYLKECFSHRSATPSKVRHVRRFISEARTKETAVFAPPPSGADATAEE